jgi:hypothetical protein
MKKINKMNEKKEKNERIRIIKRMKWKRKIKNEEEINKIE